MPCPSTPPRGHIRKSNRVYRKNSNEGADGIIFCKIKPPKEEGNVKKRKFFYIPFFVKRQKNGYNRSKPPKLCIIHSRSDFIRHYENPIQRMMHRES